MSFRVTGNSETTTSSNIKKLVVQGSGGNLETIYYFVDESLKK